MLFNSLAFLIFFPVVTLLYYITPHRFRWIVLLAASLYFYMCWKPLYVFLMLGATTTGYIAAILIARSENTFFRKSVLAVSTLLILSVLFLYKYYNFINNSISALFARFGLGYGLPRLDLILPVGISFFTFHTLSYIIDVYRGEMRPEKHFGIFTLSVSFFTQLVAGPIGRSPSLIPQFYEVHTFDARRTAYGLQRMLIGFFKKVVVADNAAIVVNTIYNSPTPYSGPYYMIATLLFAFQIYCDFSGYTDIAIGAAKVLGFDLMENFKAPYFSTNIVDFWRRWHISLSTWFKDYVYRPLGGSRVSKAKHYRNVAVVFLTSGLWHGANWTFMIWGALHAFFQIFYLMTGPLRKKGTNLFSKLGMTPITSFLSIMTTFSFVCFSWIFFRASNIHQAESIILLMAHSLKHLDFAFDPGKVGLSWELWGTIAILLAIDYYLLKDHWSLHFSKMPLFIRWGAYYFILFVILIFGEMGAGEFIYFQF